VLVDAIETIRAVVARAADGDDPFLLNQSIVELCFAVAKNGSITPGFNGEFKDEIVHTPPDRPRADRLRLAIEIPV
jgi:hypothetical protein